ncbi:MAG: hypothetical protein ACP5QJ_07515 [Thermosulfidibacteraceae bacterium]
MGNKRLKEWYILNLGKKEIREELPPLVKAIWGLFVYYYSREKITIL